MRDVSAKAYLSRGCLCFCAYSATITDTKIPRVPLRFTLGYALLPLRGVLVARCGMERTLNVGCIYLSIRYLTPLSPWRGAGGEAVYIKPEGCDGIADVRIRGIALDNGLTCGKVYRDRTYSGDIAQGFLH